MRRKPSLVLSASGALITTASLLGGMAARADATSEANLSWQWFYDLPDWLLVTLMAIVFMALTGVGLFLYRRLRRSQPSRRLTAASLASGALAGVLVAWLAAESWHEFLVARLVDQPPTAAGQPAPPPVPELLLPALPEQAMAQPRLPASALAALAGRARHAEVNFAALQDNTLVLNLFDDIDLIARRDRLAEVQEGRAWVGRVDGDDDSEVILVAKGNTLAGTVTTQGRLFEILLVNGTTHAVREIDLTQLPQEDPPAAPDTGADALAEDALGDGDVSTGEVIDLMVVYSPKALANAGGEAGIQSRILNATTAANQGYLNSNVNISLNLVHLGPVDYTEVGMTTALPQLRGTTDGIMDDIHALRDQHGADVVILISADTDYCGYAYVMRTVSTAFAPYAFGVVRDGCLSAGSFAHEIGHIMGNVHDPDNASTPGAYPDSYGYRICGKFRDIMSYSCSGEPRVNYFSNPDVYYSSWPTGILGSNDTARSMNVTSPAVASFRASATGLPEPTVPSDPSNLQASVTGGDTISLSWSDNAVDEVGYKVQSSTDGATWFEIATLAANATTFVDDGLPPGQTYHYRVFAFNSVGNSAFSNLASATLPATEVDTTPPAVKINNPANGAVLSAKTSITLSATDNVAVTGLKLYIDNKLVSSTTSSSLSYSWNVKKATSGSHAIRGDAIDAAGNLGTTSITVTKK